MTELAFRFLKSWELDQVCGVSVTRGPDQLIALHTKDNRDLVMCLYDCRQENRLPELVAQLCTAFRRVEKQNNQPRELKVSIDPNLMGLKYSVSSNTYSVVVTK